MGVFIKTKEAIENPSSSHLLLGFSGFPIQKGLTGGVGCRSRHSAQVHAVSAAHRPHSQGFGRCSTRAALERSSNLGKERRQGCVFRQFLPEADRAAKHGCVSAGGSCKMGTGTTAAAKDGKKEQVSALVRHVGTARAAPEPGRCPAAMLSSVVLLLGLRPRRLLGLTLHPTLAELSPQERSLLTGKQERLQGGLGYSHGSRLTETSGKDGKTKHIDKFCIPKSFYNRQGLL